MIVKPEKKEDYANTCEGQCYILKT